MRPTLPLLLLTAGCWGRNIPYEGGSSGEDTEVVTTACGEDADRSVGFAVEGTTLDLGTGAVAAAGLCVTAVDPSPAVGGDEPTVLAASKVCDDGAFVITGIMEAPSIGMFVLIDDCADSGEDTVMLTATGIKPEDIAGFGDGDALTGVTALSVSAELLAEQQASLEQVGWSGDLGAAGYMAGFVEDATGAPVSGAVIGCGACTTTMYYEDADATDGLYGAGSTPNTTTSAEADGTFMIPDAGIKSYTCDDGGAHEWESTLLGSLDGYAVYIRFIAN